MELSRWTEQTESESTELASPKTRQQKFKKITEIDARIARNEELIAKEHKNVVQLEQDVLDIHEMMKEVKQLAGEQQNLIDTIEHKINYSKTNAESAGNDIEKADTYNRKHQKCCIAGIILICIFLFIIIIIISV